MSNTNPTKFTGAFFGTLVGLTAASLLAVPLVYSSALHALADNGGNSASGERVSHVPAYVAPASAVASMSSPSLGGPGQAGKGSEVFASTCVACHGVDGKGRPNLGKDLVHSDFVAKLKDQELIAFIKRGRDVSDPLNTTHIPMPPKGGNPALQDPQLNDLVAFIRQLQKGA